VSVLCTSHSLDSPWRSRQQGTRPLLPISTASSLATFISSAPSHPRVHNIRAVRDLLSKAMLVVAQPSVVAYHLPLSEMNAHTGTSTPSRSSGSSSNPAQLTRSSGLASLASLAAASSSPASSSSFVPPKERVVRRPPSFERTQTAPPGSRLFRPDAGFIVTSRPPPTTLCQPISAQSSISRRKRDKDSVKADEPEEVTETRKVFWGHDAEGRRMVNQLSFPPTFSPELQLIVRP
jgi:hypothetical protein